MKINKDNTRQRIQESRFMGNNGAVLRTLNVLCGKYIRMQGLCHALPALGLDEVLESVNYLHKAGYLQLRHIETKAEAITGIADIEYRDLEGTLTADGIRLLNGLKRDDAVLV